MTEIVRETELERETQLRSLWHELYGDVWQATLDAFIVELKTAALTAPPPPPEGWFKSVVVYSLYVDLFNHDFSGLTARLSYLQSLGVTCIWLLPVLDSPMRDAGFDVRDYRKIRPELVGGLEPDKQQIFTQFVTAAHDLGIRVIFDVAINHTSEEHVWFQESQKGPDNPYRDYYIWSDTDTGYADARIIFKGMMESNWQKLDGQGYYFHRFFESQPDLNFRNPDVLLELCRVMLFWVKVGVDGFRADAVPYLWKEEGTNCENLPGTHAIVKFFRAVLDMVRSGTMVLAEACQPPRDVVDYFGNGDECHAAYHFPVMPRIYLAMAEGRAKPIFEQLALDVTPAIPDACGWFSFLRCHDELTLEMVTPEERRAIHEAYCHEPSWDFRRGEGVAARLANLFRNDARKIELAFSINFTLLGTPVIYYGDEFAKQNDEAYQLSQEIQTGYKDARYRCRGPVDWPVVDAALADPHSLSTRIHTAVTAMLTARAAHPAFAGGAMTPIEMSDPAILAFVRTKGDDRVLCIHNLGNAPITLTLPQHDVVRRWKSLYASAEFTGPELTLPAHGFGWYVPA